MNWLSHWDEYEDLEHTTEETTFEYKAPTDKEINALFDWDKLKIKEPKVIAKVKMCGGGLTFTFTDDMQFEMPTEEQCENLKKTFGIEVELVNKD